MNRSKFLHGSALSLGAMFVLGRVPRFEDMRIVEHLESTPSGWKWVETHRCYRADLAAIWPDVVDGDWRVCGFSKWGTDETGAVDYMAPLRYGRFRYESVPVRAISPDPVAVRRLALREKGR